jgi:translation initiation factor 2B subunit (eIF-2B alpha/beta/delta family)
VALLTRTFDRPVVFVCPSHRFDQKCRLDALTENELLQKDFVGGRDFDYFSLRNDVTIGEFVDFVVTDIDNFPMKTISSKLKMFQEFEASLFESGPTAAD